jgi:hypothetical protein
MARIIISPDRPTAIGIFPIKTGKRIIFKLFLLFLLTVFLLINSVSVASGQRTREEPPPFKERLFFGGSFGLQFGTYTDIEVAPVVGLWLLPRLNVALGPKYRFYKDPFDRTDIYGGRVYTQFSVIKDLNNMIPAGLHLGFFLHAEDELLSLQSSFWKSTPGITDRFFLNTLLAGAGISQPMGRRSSMNIMFLWALNESQYGLYSNPEIRVSFIF